MKQLVSCTLGALITVAAGRIGYISGKGCQAIMLRWPYGKSIGLYCNENSVPH